MTRYFEVEIGDSFRITEDSIPTIVTIDRFSSMRAYAGKIKFSRQAITLNGQIKLRQYGTYKMWTYIQN